MGQKLFYKRTGRLTSRSAKQTPPVASVLMVSCSIAKANIWETSKLNVYFIATLIFVLLLVTYAPFVSLGLVDFFYLP